MHNVIKFYWCIWADGDEIFELDGGGGISEPLEFYAQVCRDFSENGRKMGSKRIRQALLATASPGRIQSASLYKNASLHVESRKHDWNRWEWTVLSTGKISRTLNFLLNFEIPESDEKIYLEGADGENFACSLSKQFAKLRLNSYLPVSSKS